MILHLALFLRLAIWQDCLRQRVSNRLIILALLDAIVYQCIQKGVLGISYSIIQAGIVFLLLFLLYVCRAVGAGDIKLLCVTAVFLSWRHAMFAFLVGLYLSLIPIGFLIFHKKKLIGRRLPMCAPIAAGIFLSLCKEGFF